MSENKLLSEADHTSENNVKETDSAQESGSAIITIVRDADGIPPNISLNCHDITNRAEIYATALIGIIIQFGVVVFSGFITYYPPIKNHFKKNSKAEDNYAFPCTAIGTVALVVGMFLCAFVIEQSTTETYYKASGENRIFVVWLQKDHVLSDQTFQPYAVYPMRDRKYITISRRRSTPGKKRIGPNRRGVSLKKDTTNNHGEQDQSEKNETKVNGINQAGDDKMYQQPDKNDGTYMPLETATVVGTAVSLVGFFLQFIGLRGMNWTASVAQLGAMILMTALRVWVQRGLAQPPASSHLTSDFELDWFAINLGNLSGVPWITNTNIKGPDESGKDQNGPKEEMLWIIRTGGIDEHQPLENVNDDKPKAESAAQQVMDMRKQLGSLVRWRGPASTEAVCLSQAIEIIADTFLPLPKDGMKSYAWKLPVEHNISNTTDEHIHEHISIELSPTSNGWKVSIGEIEAILSLWMYSIRNREKKDAHDGLQVSKDEVRLKERAESGLRLVGSSRSKKQLLRDLQWWMPGVVPKVSEIEFPTVEATEDERRCMRSIQRQRVVGSGIEKPAGIASFGKTLHFSSRLAKGSSDSDDDSDSGNNIDLEDQVSFNGTAQIENVAPDFENGILAIQCFDTLERLLSRDLLVSFVRTITKLPQFDKIAVSHLPPISYNEIKVNQDTFKLKNDKLSAIAEKMANSGFGTMSEVYFDLIVPLSMEQQLSDAEDIIPAAQEQAQKYEMSGEWGRLEEVCLWLFDLARKFEPIQEFSYSWAMAVCLEFLYRMHREERLQIAEGREEQDITWRTEKLRIKMRGEFAISQLLMLINAQGEDEKYNVLSELLGASHKERETTFPESFRLTQAHLWAMRRGAKGTWKQTEPDFGKQDAFGWTPLHYGANTTSDLGLDLELFQYMHNVDTLSSWGRTPLFYACLRGHTQLVDYLLEKGASVDIAGSDGVTPMHCAAKKGNEYMVWRLLVNDKKGKGSSARDCNERAPIHWAAVGGHTAVVKLLRDDIGLKDRFGWTCLHIAAVYGHTDLLTYLLGAGADKDQADNLSYTPLRLAVTRERKKAADILLTVGAKTDTLKLGKILLQAAAESDRADVIRVLIEKGANKDWQDRWDETPLGVATYNGNNEAACALIEAGADVNNRSLEMAIRNCSLTVVQLLLAKGAKEDTDNFSLLQSAIRSGNVDKLKFIIEKRKEESLGEIARREIQEETILHSVCKYVSRFHGKSTEALHALLEIGAQMNINAKNWEDKTPLDIATGGKAEEEFIKALKELGAKRSSELPQEESSGSDEE